MMPGSLIRASSTRPARHSSKATTSSPSGGCVANYCRMPRKRPVVVRYIPLSIREAIDLGAAPKRNGLQLSVFASQVVLQVVCHDGDITCIVDNDLWIELL